MHFTGSFGGLVRLCRSSLERKDGALYASWPSPQLSRGTKSLAIHSHWHPEELWDHPAADMGTSITRSLLFLPHCGIVARGSVWLGTIPPSLPLHLHWAKGLPPKWSTKVTQGRANISHLLLPCPTDCLHRIPTFSKMEEPLVPNCDKFLSN